jgi:hypothetical protein
MNKHSVQKKSITPTQPFCRYYFHNCYVFITEEEERHSSDEKDIDNNYNDGNNIQSWVVSFANQAINQSINQHHLLVSFLVLLLLLLLLLLMMMLLFSNPNVRVFHSTSWKFVVVLVSPHQKSNTNMLYVIILCHGHGSNLGKESPDRGPSNHYSQYSPLGHEQ